MKHVVISGAARRDLKRIWRYVVTDSGSIEMATRLVNAISNRFDLLSHSPAAGTRRSELDEDLRGFPFGNYLIYYRVTAENVVIARILHAAREQSSSFASPE